MASLSLLKTHSAPPLWRQVQKTNFTSIERLAAFLELSPENRSRLLHHPRFVLNLPRRLAEKIEKNNLDDPLFRQFVPLLEELEQKEGFFADPVQDQSFRKTKKILHKYEGRALLVTTSACAMHCRYCFRQNFPYETADKTFEEELRYIASDPSLTEIILSGGDPLSLSDETLGALFLGLASIPHVKRIRFHTRFPLGIPERIDKSFLELLASAKQQIFFVIHCNHARELDAGILSALKKIHYLGIPVLNQSVLLQGVNDDEKTLHHLSETLLENGILPYYLHELDPVQGASHFALPASRGPELIRYVQSKTSGFGVPRLVKEEPGMPSKTPVPVTPGCK